MCHAAVIRNQITAVFFFTSFYSSSTLKNVIYVALHTIVVNLMCVIILFSRNFLPNLPNFAKSSLFVYREGDIVKQPMKKGSFVPKNVPGVGWGGVGWVGHEGVGWGGS